MSCLVRSREKESLLAYTSGKMPPQEAKAFEAHLSECSACREAVSQQKAVLSALDGWAAPPVSADFDRRLYERIQNEVGWWERLVRPFRALVGTRGVPVAATAALLVIAGAGFLLKQPGDLTPEVPETAQVEAVAPDQAESALTDMEMIREFSSIMRAEAASPKM